MSTTNTFQTTVAHKSVTVNNILKDFTIYNRASSMIAYIAVNAPTQELFIQFNNGKGFIYKEVPMIVLTGIIAAPSVGKFFHATIKDKIAGEEVESNCIVPTPEEEEEEDDEFGLGDDLDFEGVEI